MKIIVNKIIPFKGYIALTIFNRIFVNEKLKDKFTNIVENHERIHLNQQKELGNIKFLILYLWEYFVNLLIYKNHQLAYRNISFELEAKTNEQNLNYLKTREKYAYKKYKN